MKVPAGSVPGRASKGAQGLAWLAVVATLGCGASGAESVSDTDADSSSSTSLSQSGPEMGSSEPGSTGPSPSSTEPPDSMGSTGRADTTSTTSTTGTTDEASSGGVEPSSPGCGVESPASGAFDTLNIDVDGTIRTFHIFVPASYDPLRSYPIVFRWHGATGTGLSGGLDIEEHAGDDAIIVAPDGLGTNWSGGSQQNDLALFDLLLEVVSENYCIDPEALFSYGYSAGGGMTNLLACVRGDVLRASATVAGSNRGSDCVGEPAVWLLHDTDDASVAISNAMTVRDRHLAANGCSMRSTPEGDSCVRYEGCSSPVVWCQSSGVGHNIQGNFAPPLVWDFFAEFVSER